METGDDRTWQIAAPGGLHRFFRGSFSIIFDGSFQKKTTIVRVVYLKLNASRSRAAVDRSIIDQFYTDGPDHGGPRGQVR